MNSEFVAQQVLGFVGVVMALILSSSPVLAMSTRNQEGSLGGLDTQYWPLYWINNMLWCIYSTMIGDAWVLMSVLPPAVMWLHFCFGAIRLLGQEEGELLPMSKPTFEEGVLVQCEQGSPELHESSVKHRLQRIRWTTLSITTCMSCFLVLNFIALSPKLVDGIVAWDSLIAPALRVKIVGTIAALSSLICHVIPIRGLYAIFKLRNASSIYVPTVAGWLLVCTTWGSYGWLKMDYNLYGPNTIGVCIYLCQLFLKYIFRNAKAASGEKLTHPAGLEDVKLDSGVSAPNELLELLDISAKLHCSTNYEMYLLWQKYYRCLRQSQRVAHAQVNRHSSKMLSPATSLHSGQEEEDIEDDEVPVTELDLENRCRV